MMWLDVFQAGFTALCVTLSGRIFYTLGRHAERRSVTVVKPLEPVCSCGHGSGKHPGDGGHCGGTTTVRQSWTQNSPSDVRWKDQILECGCTVYDGPDPETVRMIRGA